MAGNNTQNSNNNKDRALTIFDTGDNTKAVTFNVEYVTTATTRTWTVDDRNINFDAVPTSVTTDSGTCTPAIGTFSVVGAGTVSTAGTGSTITITGTGGGGASTSSFIAYLATWDESATGDGTSFMIGSGSAWTEISDIGSDFNTNGTYTAPETGKYILGFACHLDNVAAAHQFSSTLITTSNRTYSVHHGNIAAQRDGDDQISLVHIVTADMDASDIATFTVSVAGGTRIVDIIVSGTVTYCYGYLIS